MYARKKIEKEIARKRKLIEDSENLLKQIPEHLRSTQEFVLEIYKKELAAFEQELMKLEDQNFKNKRP